jgi:hypothetical protein
MMNTATIDVPFDLLNTLTSNLRTAGAKFYVDKIENFFRISIKQEPKIASVTDILNYTQGLVAEPVAIAEVADDAPAMTTLEQLEDLNYGELKALAKSYQIPGYHKAKKAALVEALVGKVLASEIA